MGRGGVPGGGVRWNRVGEGGSRRSGVKLDRTGEVGSSYVEWDWVEWVEMGWV